MSVDIENNKRVEKLDEAFLFIISLVTVLFTIIQVFFEGITGLIELSPLMFIGVVMPFYIGYVRGAIIYNSNVERLRGWVYLAIGSSTFFALFLTRINPLLYWIFILFSLSLAYKLIKWFDFLFKIKDEISAIYAYFGTLIAGVSLAIVLQLESNFLLKDFITITSLIDQVNVILSTIWGFFIFIIFERLSRQIVGLKLPLTSDEINKRKRADSSPMYFLQIGLLTLPFEMFFVIMAQDLRIKFLVVQTVSFLLIGSALSVRFSIFGTLYMLFALVLAVLSLFLFFRIKKIDFSKIKTQLQSINEKTT